MFSIRYTGDGMYIALHRYKITRADGFIRYAANEKEKNGIMRQLSDAQTEYTVEPIDTSAYEHCDGQKVTSRDMAEALVYGSYATPLSIDDLALALTEQYEMNLTLRDELEQTKAVLTDLHLALNGGEPND